MWTGSAFSCATNEILLRHSAGAEGDCNCNDTGPIRGRSIHFDNETLKFTSELYVTVSNGFNNKTVQCFFVPNVGMQIEIGQDSLITVITGI